MDTCEVCGGFIEKGKSCNSYFCKMVEIQECEQSEMGEYDEED